MVVFPTLFRGFISPKPFVALQCLMPLRPPFEDGVSASSDGERISAFRLRGLRVAGRLEIGRRAVSLAILVHRRRRRCDHGANRSPLPRFTVPSLGARISGPILGRLAWPRAHFLRHVVQLWAYISLASAALPASSPDVGSQRPGNRRRSAQNGIVAGEVVHQWPPLRCRANGRSNSSRWRR